MTTDTAQAHRYKGDTWPQVLKYNCDKWGNTRTAMRHKHHGAWVGYTWQDYYLNCKYLALGLLSLGFQTGDKVLIVGNNAPQWYFAELAAQSNRGAAVGTRPDLTPAEIKYIADNCDARFAVVGDQEQVDKLLEIGCELPKLTKVIHWNYKGLAHYADPLLVGYRQVLERGEKYEVDHPGTFEQNVAMGKADDICLIVYTSGTAGAAPKGAVHTYKSVRPGADYMLFRDPWYASDNVVPHLPPVGMTEQSLYVTSHLLSGCTLDFTEAPETHRRDAREVQPDIVCQEARQWESQAATIQARILAADALKRFAYRSCMPVGYQMADLSYRKLKPGVAERLKYGLADLVMFKPIRAALGLSKARICYSYGAMLSPAAIRFYHALSLPLKNLYGTAESGVLTCPPTDDIRCDTVGPINRETQVKATAKGELIYQHPGIFVGYYNDPAQTAAVLEDGWFHSGDSGFVRDDGHIVLVDRLNDVSNLVSGDKLTPQMIESQLRTSPYIKDAWVLAGPTGAFPSAIIVINHSSVGRWAGQNAVGFTTFADLSQKRQVHGLIKQYVDEINQTLSPASQVRKFVILHKEFDPDEGELTRSRKLRRTLLQERYRELIEAIYADKAEVAIQERVTLRDGRVGMTETVLSIQSIDGAAL